MGRQRGIRRVGWAAKGNRESGLGGGGEQDGAAEANREIEGRGTRHGSSERRKTKGRGRRMGDRCAYRLQ